MLGGILFLRQSVCNVVQQCFWRGEIQTMDNDDCCCRRKSLRDSSCWSRLLSSLARWRCSDRLPSSLTRGRSSQLRLWTVLALPSAGAPVSKPLHVQTTTGLTSHSTQNRSLWRCSSQPISWLYCVSKLNITKQTCIHNKNTTWTTIPFDGLLSGTTRISS